MKKLVLKYNQLTDKLKDLSLLAMRLLLAYGFYKPAIMKFEKTELVVKSFTKSGIPFPTFNVYLAGFTEVLGVILLVLGLGTRIISFPLIITMLVAIFVVHWDNGYSALDRGYQIPLFYLIMLFVLMANGAGKISIDHLISKKRNN